MRYRYLRFPEGKTKALTFSYDDCPISDKRLAGIFDKYGMKGTFNINAKTKLTTEEIREFILDKGHEIAIHGDKHVGLTVTTSINSIKEALFGRMALEERFGMIVRGMAYPDVGLTVEFNGNTAERVKLQLADLGVVYSRTAGGDNDQFSLPSDWYAWMPTSHHDNPMIFDYIDKFLDLNVNGMYCSSRRPRLMYIWGHSFEFDRKNNWERIEKICEKLTAKEDIWYATNIEIYDYVKAYDSLVFSADNTIVYNPTLIKVWFDVDGKLYSIDSGETLKIPV